MRPEPKFKFQHACCTNNCKNILYSEDLMSYHALHLRRESFSLNSEIKDEYIHEGYNFSFFCKECKLETVVRKFELSPPAEHENLVYAFHSNKRRIAEEAGEEAIEGFVTLGSIALPEKSGGCTPFEEVEEIEKGTIKYADPKLHFISNYNHPQYGQPVLRIEWGAHGRGFGEYSFMQEGDHLSCENECDDKTSILKVLEHVLASTTLDSSWDD